MSRLSADSQFEDGVLTTGSMSSPPLSLSQDGQAETGDFAFSTDLTQFDRVNAPSDFSVWTNANATLADGRPGGESDHDLATAEVGVDYLTTPGLLFGSLVEVDSMAQASSDSSGGADPAESGAAWMVGPYMAAHLPHLFINGRVAVGDASDHIDPIAHFQDEFSSVNAMSEINVSGGWSIGNLHFDPTSRVTFYEGRQDGFMDAGADFIPAEGLTMAGATFGPEVNYDFRNLPGLDIEPAMAVNALWNFQRDVATIDPQAEESFQAQTEFSAEIKTTTGLSLKCSVDYDGIGANQSHDFKGLVAINLPLSD